MATPLEIIKKKRAQAVNKIIAKGFLASKRVYIGMATCEIAAGSKEIMDIFKKAAQDGLDIYVSQKGCVGRCNLEPTVEVVEEGKLPVKYCKVNCERAEQIVQRHLKNGEVIKEWVIE